MNEKTKNNEAVSEKNESNIKSQQNKYLNKSDWIILGIVCLSILIVGLILIFSGLNRSFYISNENVKAIFNIFTQLGSEMAYIIMIPVIIFAIDFKLGKKLLIGFMVSTFFNSLLKYTINDPRPPTNFIDGHPIEDSPGFPSGHAQSSIAFWGYIFYHNKAFSNNLIKDKIIQVICILLIILITISRVIIGVHDIDDIVGGLIIGFLILAIYLEILPRIESSKLKDKSLVIKIVIGLVISLIFWLSFALAFPSSAEPIGQAAGLLIASSIGYPLEEVYIKFNPKEYKNSTRIICGVIGIIFTMIIYFGLSLVFGLINGPIWLLRCIRYIILGSVIIILVPFILVKIFKK